MTSENTKFAEALFRKDPDWHVPYLWRSEYRNAVTGHMRAGAMDQNTAIKVIEEAEKHFKGKEYLVNSQQIMACVANSGCSAYACEFVALAKNLNAPLITMDRQIIKNFPDVAQSLTSFAK